MNAWILSTNHSSIAVMYFIFVITAACAGLLLATIIRIELALPGIGIIENNAESYLTVISLHGLVMVFFVIIPVIFGAFGNFLLPTQLGVSDVAFPSLNSFMFWVTPSSFVLLLHIFFFDKEPGTPTAKVLTSGSHGQVKDQGRFGFVSSVVVHEVRDTIWSKLHIVGPTISIEISEWWYDRMPWIDTSEWSFSLLGRALRSLWVDGVSAIVEFGDYAIRRSRAKTIQTVQCGMLRYNLYAFTQYRFHPEYSKLTHFGIALSIIGLDLGVSKAFHSLRSGYHLLSHAYITLSWSPHPNFSHFYYRVMRDKLPCSAYWTTGSAWEASFGMHIEQSLKNKFLEYKWMPATAASTPMADISASQFGALQSVAFDAPKSAYISASLISPLYMKVSSWVSNQLIPGWAFVTPYASSTSFAAVGKVDIALVVVFAVGLGSVFSALNYVITYSCVSAPQFKNSSELRSFFVDGLLVGSRMMLAANPALLIAIWLMLSDSHLGTSYFDFSGGGDVVLFQHLFWFFGHPEVYIIIIPCFGVINSLMPHFLRKSLSGRLSLQFSMYTIAFMGFAVWGHHMYMVGLANTTSTLYSTMTVMISVPASTKVLHWCVTLVNSAPQWDVSFLFLLSFTYFFTLGGLSGMFNAHIGFDVALHDTFYVIGHFHVMLAGAATSCVFAAFYFYFAAIFGVKYSSVFAYLHFVFYFFGQALTLIPMFWLGYSGMPRRILDYPAYFGGWHSIISSGHLLTVMGFIFFLAMLLDSFYEGAAPHSITLGVASLNTSFAFYAYERSRVAQTSSLVAPLCRGSADLSFVHLEPSSVRYVFDVKGHAVSRKFDA